MDTQKNLLNEYPKLMFNPWIRFFYFTLKNFAYLDLQKRNIFFWGGGGGGAVGGD